MINKKIYLALDLKDDPALIEKYKAYHAPGNAWPEVTKSIKDAGIVDMEIFLTGNRLFMIMTVDESYDLNKNAEEMATNPIIKEWETLMDNFQQQLPWAEKEQKWVPMEQIFKLGE